MSELYEDYSQEEIDAGEIHDTRSHSEVMGRQGLEIDEPKRWSDEVENMDEILDLMYIELHVKKIREAQQNKGDPSVNTPIGFDLTGWELALLNPDLRNDLITHGLKLFPKWVDFWAMGHPIKGIDSPDIHEAICGTSIQIELLTPTRNVVSYAETRKDRLEDALLYFVQLWKSPLRPAPYQLLTGSGSYEFWHELRRIYKDLRLSPTSEYSKKIYDNLTNIYPSSILQFHNRIALDMYREAQSNIQANNQEGVVAAKKHPTSLLYSRKLKKTPAEAARDAKRDEELKYTLNLNIVKKGVTLYKSISIPGWPTREVEYKWYDILGELLPYTNVVVVKADVKESIELRKRSGIYTLDEFSQIIRGMPTQLGTMLRFAKKSAYKGRVVIQMEPPEGQYKSFRVTEACIVVNFMQDHFNPLPPLKPKNAVDNKDTTL